MNHNIFLHIWSETFYYLKNIRTTQFYKFNFDFPPRVIYLESIKEIVSRRKFTNFIFCQKNLHPGWKQKRHRSEVMSELFRPSKRCLYFESWLFSDFYPRCSTIWKMLRLLYFTNWILITCLWYFIWKVSWRLTWTCSQMRSGSVFLHLSWNLNSINLQNFTWIWPKPWFQLHVETPGFTMAKSPARVH